MFLKINQRNYHVTDLIVRIACVALVIYWVMPWRFASHYEYLQRNEIQRELVEQVTSNISMQRMPACEYSDILADNVITYLSQYREHVLRGEEILPGGEYFPEDCSARFSTAIIVPYRKREEQLHAFLVYMHNYLRQQRIHYRIFLVEQYDQKPFNRAKLFNIGSVIAAELEFPCLILHDVDLLPMNLGQLYACTQKPRHMSSALDIFRFTLPYGGLFGGVVAIQTHQYRFINGMSNLYEGWGGEDDDFYARVCSHKLGICRFDPSYSTYTMMPHKQEKKNENRIKLLRSGYKRFEIDGLNSLVYTEKERRLHSLFTHILVET
ncbi:beta-1,4-N-acetylgalactosaminyltransferase bre-4 [Zeugodacus cucurbitae]|uniref:Beta-1,4-N-acetylgalactosaminyltransferase n=1 Tax=Zeugodacus cucurbitae TaxID=28588 RepID=A0A0A1XME8_ZEUCU|nr:beta-1,4-N-acetylgalactosaminyltransferase bre-4 [Zeugodacus cucurbitae]